MVLSKTFSIIIVIIFFTSTAAANNNEFAVVTRKEIISFFIEKNNVSMNTGSDNIVAAAFDRVENYVYISYENKKIYRYKKTKWEFNDTTLIVDEQPQIVNGMVYDTTSGTLYWTSNNGIFYVVVLTIPMYKPLKVQTFVKDDGKIPLKITYNFFQKYLYWVNSDSETRKKTIERISFNGSDREVVVRDVDDPRDIAIDLNLNTLYWINYSSKHGHSINRMDMWEYDARKNGTQDKGTWESILSKEEWRPSFIAVDKQNVYWIDESSKEMWMMHKISSEHDVSATMVTNIELGNELIGLFVLVDHYPSLVGKLIDKNKDKGSTNRAKSYNDYVIVPSNESNKNYVSEDSAGSNQFRKVPKKKSTLAKLINHLLGTVETSKH